MAGVKKKAKAKKVVKKPKRVRKAFGFSTQQAKIRVIEFRGKRCLLRIPSGNLKPTKQFARRMFVLHKIFHTLFPKNSINPVGIKSIKEKDKTSWGMVSEILKNRSSEYKITHALYYESPLRLKLSPDMIEKAYAKHLGFVYKKADPFSMKLAEKTGIYTNEHRVNICNVKGKPVFFEIDSIKTNRLLAFIESNVKNQKTKEMLKTLVKELPSNYSPVMASTKVRFQIRHPNRHIQP